MIDHTSHSDHRISLTICANFSPFLFLQVISSSSNAATNYRSRDHYNLEEDTTINGLRNRRTMSIFEANYKLGRPTVVDIDLTLKLSLWDHACVKINLCKDFYIWSHLILCLDSYKWPYKCNFNCYTVSSLII